jgi:effector-binding domain-containing protein
MQTPESIQIKNVKPIQFLYYEVTTTMAELGSLVGHVIEDLYADAIQQKLFIGGPAYWNYFNFQGPDKPFDLEICLPIGKAAPNYKGKYQLKVSKPFKCVSFVHEGSWEKFPESYVMLRDHIIDSKFGRTGESREIYVNIDFENPEANLTEIQIGIE